MLGTSSAYDSKRPRWFVSVTVGVMCLVLTLVCIGNLALWGRQIRSRPVVGHVGQFALSAEITDNPSCAPLADSCWVLHAGDRPQYFSVWFYTSPQQAGQPISEWHVIAIRLGSGQANAFTP